jgi:ABC-type multidrug transport system fused ATPase/permease subunit
MNGYKEYKWITDLVFVLGVIVFLAIIAYKAIEARGSSTPYSLSQRIPFLSVSERIGDPIGDRKVIYAKERLSFKGPSGVYTVRGYLRASQPLNAIISIYVRAKDPADDPTCEVLTAPSQTQRGVMEPSYVCERGQGDARAAVVQFANVSFASFCSSNSEAYRVVAQGEFWIGVAWDPFLPHPLTLLFDDLTALKVVSFRPHPCASDLQ